MKKILIFLSLGILLATGATRAQVPITLPNGSFEQWTNHQGYTVMYVIQVYGSYTTPTNWNYLSYPVNESLGAITINTNIPLIKASKVTGNVPDGNNAVRLQTFMLSDIISSTVLNLAGDAIDSSLRQQVIPSILTTGAIDVESVLPLVTNMLSGSGDILAMLPTLLTMDVNDYVSGGIDLGGYRPGRLTGSYKYQSATSGDNGAVIMVGTRHNTVTNKRDIVGVGLNLSLYDTSEYTPFEVEYMPLNALVAGMPSPDPDSVILIAVSSASTNMQQGSALFLDNLVLWSAPDTCADITSFATVPDIHEAVLNWSVTDPADGFEIEYGEQGFEPGTGTVDTLTGTTLTLTGLDASTQYDVYVRTVCSDTVYGEWSMVQFTTGDDTCATVVRITLNDISSDGEQQMVLQWSGSSTPGHWEVEYGTHDFEHGTGTTVTVSRTSYAIYQLELQPNTEYDFYVRSVCDSSIYGDWAMVSYRTPCAPIEALTVSGSNITATGDNMLRGYVASWNDNSGTSQWEVMYGISGTPEDAWGTMTTVLEPQYALPALMPETMYTVAVRPSCGNGNFGPIARTSFTTESLMGIDNVGTMALKASPNPAHGQCTVTTTNSQPSELRLYSLDGRLLQTINSTGEPVVLQLSATGVFLLEAFSAEGTSMMKIVNE